MAGKERGEDSLYNKCDLDIVHAATVHHDGIGPHVIWYDSSRHEKVRDSITQVFDRVHSSPTIAAATLGKLDILPLEILQEIFDVLDIQSLFRFRQLNLHARYLISTQLRYYRTVTTHALDAFCAILQTQVAPYYTLRDLYDVLCTEECAECGSFGRFIFLLLLIRCCYSCLGRAIPFHVIDLRVITHDYPPAQVPSYVPRLRVVHGDRPLSCAPTRGTTIVAVEHLLDSVDGIDCVCVSSKECHCCLLNERLGTWTVQDTASCYSAAALLPYFDKRDGSVQYGVFCEGCQAPSGRSLDPEMDRFRRYSVGGFLEHFRQCARAQSFMSTQAG